MNFFSKNLNTFLIFNFCIFFLFPFFGNTNAQSREEIANDNIKCVTVSIEKEIKGKIVTQKESETLYDKKGNIIEEIEYKDGKINKRIKYQYDNNNKKTKEITYDQNGKLIKTEEFKYNGEYKIEKITTDPLGKIKSKKYYKYEKF